MQLSIATTWSSIRIYLSHLIMYEERNNNKAKDIVAVNRAVDFSHNTIFASHIYSTYAYLNVLKEES